MKQLLLSVLACLLVASCQEQARFQYFEYSGRLHTPYHIKYEYKEPLDDEIRAELDRFYHLFNAFDSTSVVSHINRNEDLRVADSTFVLATVDGRVAGGFIEERFIQPLFSSSVDFAVLSPASASGLGEAIDALEVGRTGFEAKVLSGLLDVLSSIVYEKEEMLHLADGFQDSRLERMLDFMKSNLGRRLTLEQVASAGFVSLREASRLFERHLSSSPMKFFLSMRLEKARSLLERGDLPMADICQQTGFESVSHFSTSFRKAYSVTPSEYRSRFR